jgi:hypothetical protein
LFCGNCLPDFVQVGTNMEKSDEMPYFKMHLGRGQGNAHIVVDNVEVGQRVLCGREIKSEMCWKSISELSGDECERCASKTKWVEKRVGRVPADLFDGLFDDEPVYPRLPRCQGPSARQQGRRAS